MRKSLPLMLIIASLGGLIITATNGLRLNYWLSPPKEKFFESWSADLDNLKSSGKLPKAWDEIKQISVKSDNSPAQDWLATTPPIIKTNSHGNYRLEIFVIHWIEGTRYGVVVQHSLLDLQNNNTVWELSRTYPLGFVY